MTQTTQPVVRNHPDELVVGFVSISDRASAGTYQDEGIPALREWFGRTLTTPWQAVERLIPDEQAQISRTLIDLVDVAGCDLVLTTGARPGAPRRDARGHAGRGYQGNARLWRADAPGQPAFRADRDPVATGSGDPRDHQPRRADHQPARPAARIRETLEGLRDADGKAVVQGIFAAVPYCIDLIGGPYLETDEAIVKAWRPKNAVRAKPAA